MNSNLRYKIPLLIFFILVFLISWGIWLTRGLDETIAGVLGAWGPGLAGILLTLLFQGWKGIQTLLRRLVSFKFGSGLYLAALFLPVIISLTSTAISSLGGASAPDFAHPPILQTTLLPPEVAQSALWLLLPVMLISQLLGSSLGEELGWRGYALPRLQYRSSPLLSSVYLGFMWGIWHLPRIGLLGAGFDLTLFVSLVAGTIISAVFYTWLYNASGGSLVPCLLLHTSQALTLQFLAEVDAPLIKFLVSLVAAALIIFYTRGLVPPVTSKPEDKYMPN